MHPSRYDSLGALLEDALFTRPTSIAAIEVTRKRETARLTYAGFRQGAERVARWMADQGLGPGARIAIAMPNQPRWLMAAYAALRVGATLVPLDARLEPTELATLLRHCRADALFVQDDIARRLPATDTPRVIVAGDHGPTNGTLQYDALDSDTSLPAHTRTRDDIACLVYSSGTGGDPKGCKLTHGNYLAQLEALLEWYGWRPEDRYFSILPSNHAIDFMCGFIAPFVSGATVVHQRAIRPEFIVDTMRRYRVTQMALVPLVLKAFERSLNDKLDALPARKRHVFDALLATNAALTERSPWHGMSRWLLKPIHDAFGGHLRMVFCGGAFTDRKRAEFFYKLGLPVVIGYGLTEACTVVTLNDMKPFRADSVGRPVPGTELRIHAPDARGVGEVQVRGPTVFAGYLDDAEQTAAAFDGEWLRTGDLGYLDAANHLHLVGRRKNMIVTPGGKNIYPEDIEHVFEDLPCEELAIFAEDWIWPRDGLTGERLVAVVRPKDGAHGVLSSVRERNLKLPDFKRIAGVLSWDDVFPRTTSMKVKRNALADAIRERAARDDIQAVQG